MQSQEPVTSYLLVLRSEVASSNAALEHGDGHELTENLGSSGTATGSSASSARTMPESMAAETAAAAALNFIFAGWEFRGIYSDAA